MSKLQTNYTSLNGKHFNHFLSRVKIKLKLKAISLSIYLFINECDEIFRTVLYLLANKWLTELTKGLVSTDSALMPNFYLNLNHQCQWDNGYVMVLTTVPDQRLDNLLSSFLFRSLQVLRSKHKRMNIPN